MPKPKILIAGGGIGGLAAAGCLLQAGYDVEVFEQAGELTEIGAGIQFSANAVHVLRHLGIANALDPLAFRPEAYNFRLHDSAEIIQRFPIGVTHEQSHGAPYYQVHRADIYNLLVQHVNTLKPDAIHLNHRVTDFSETDNDVGLKFADGSEARGEMLIGADGVKSIVRQLLVGDTEAEYTGDIAWRITVPTHLMPAGFADNAISVWMGPNAHAVIYYVRGGDLVNFVGIVETDEHPEESWTTKHSWEELKSDFVGWHHNIQTLIDLADRDGCYRWALHIRQPIENWSSRRVTLLGDAAHPTLPYLAQGAAMALEDAAIVTRALDQSETVTDALALYQRNRVPRAARIVNESTANRSVFHTDSVEELRNIFAKRNMGKERNHWLYSYHPLEVDLI